MVLMTWLYVTGIMLLLGAEMNMVMENAAVRAHAVPTEDQAPVTIPAAEPDSKR